VSRVPSVQDVSRNMLVVRLRPVTPTKLVEHAHLEFRYSNGDHYGISVFGTIPMPGESEDDTIERLWRVILTQLKDDRRYWVSTQAGNLLDRGFVFIKDEESGELPEHYCVSLTPPDEARAKELMEGFEERRRG
jgi:hypothetical protein